MCNYESFFCQYCDATIGFGSIVSAICHYHENTCIQCRWDIINTIIVEYNLSISSNFLEKMNLDLIKEYGPEQIKKYDEIIQQLKIIHALDEAVANLDLE